MDRSCSLQRKRGRSRSSRQMKRSRSSSRGCSLKRSATRKSRSRSVKRSASRCGRSSRSSRRSASKRRSASRRRSASKRRSGSKRRCLSKRSPSPRRRKSRSRSRSKSRSKGKNKPTYRCFKPGPVTNNGYLNFLRYFRRCNCGLSPQDIVKRGARKWCSLTPEERRRYIRMACKVTTNKRKQRSLLCESNKKKKC